jgi:hypothetical protein
MRVTCEPIAGLGRPLLALRRISGLMWLSRKATIRARYASGSAGCEGSW